MSKSFIAVMVCDRCEAVEELRQEFRSCSWGRINAAEANGPKWIGDMTGKTFKDICPACVDSLMKWWEMKRRDACLT